MRIHIEHPKYGIEAHDDLLRQWHAASEDERRGPLTIDLWRTTFVDPYGLCALVLFLNHLPDRSLPVRLKLPRWPQEPPISRAYLAQNPQSRVPVGAASRGPKTFVRAEKKPPREWRLQDLAPAVRYLTRMGFWEEVGDRLDVPRDWIPVRPLWEPDPSALLDISIMHTHDAISVVLRKTGEILQSLHYTPVGRGHILEVLSELCSNVLMHAKTEFGAIASMQTYKTSSGARYVVMAIGDHGIGVRASLAANPKMQSRLESDAQALGVAMQPGASRFDVGGHGGGLPRVLEIARRYGGRVVARSGSGAFSFNGSTQAKQSFEVPAIEGTMLRIALPKRVCAAKRSRPDTGKYLSLGKQSGAAESTDSAAPLLITVALTPAAESDSRRSARRSWRCSPAPAVGWKLRARAPQRSAVLIAVREPTQQAQRHPHARLLAHFLAPALTTTNATWALFSCGCRFRTVTSGA
jgi:hypothetical protein